MNENEPKGTVCSTCAFSIWCGTWTDWKCTEYKMRKGMQIISCPKYKKRPKDFKEKPCRCDDCLSVAGDKEE